MRPSMTVSLVVSSYVNATARISIEHVNIMTRIFESSVTLNCVKFRRTEICPTCMVRRLNDLLGGRGHSLPVDLLLQSTVAVATVNQAQLSSQDTLGNNRLMRRTPCQHLDIAFRPTSFSSRPMRLAQAQVRYLPRT